MKIAIIGVLLYTAGVVLLTGAWAVAICFAVTALSFHLSTLCRDQRQMGWQQASAS